jgi:hypothetical protein
MALRHTQASLILRTPWGGAGHALLSRATARAHLREELERESATFRLDGIPRDPGRLTGKAFDLYPLRLEQHAKPAQIAGGGVTDVIRDREALKLASRSRCLEESRKHSFDLARRPRLACSDLPL